MCKGLNFIVGLVFLSTSLSAYGQNDNEPDEVLLTFSHSSVGQFYLSAFIFGDVAFLPVGEILNLLEIPSEQISTTKGIYGNYPTPKDYWEVNTEKNEIRIGNNKVDLPEDSYYLGEMDLYLHPKVFRGVFGLNFTFSISTLSLSLQAQYTLPVEENKKREQLRSRVLNGASKKAIDAPLLYPRERKWLKMGMVDYNINQLISRGEQTTQGLFNIGMEAFGGDFQGRVNVVLSEQELQAVTQGLRWRYVLPAAMQPERNAAITSVSVGNVFTGARSEIGNLAGISLTNEPIVPRQELDLFVIDGHTEPDSEVELLMSGQLVDFTRADELGYYRFNTPINFGAQQLGIRIYTPQGKVIQEDRQIQIPYTFLPRKFLTYNIQAGRPRINSDSLGNEMVVHSNIAYGISNSLTARVGADYRAGQNAEFPYSYVGLSARVFQQYLINADLVPRRYAITDASVIFSNNTNISLQYKEYFQDAIYNPRNNVRDLSLNVFWPFQVLGKISGIRVGGTSEETFHRMRNSILGDFNTQLGRTVARVNFRGYLSELYSTENELGFNDHGGTLTSSLTYTLARSPKMPTYVQGMFLRGQYSYNPFIAVSQNFSFLLSQTLFKRGRFTLAYDHNLVHKTGRLQIGFLYDFNFLRTSTQYQSSGGDRILQQSFTGSIAYDPTGVIIPSNRDQVTRAGVSVKLFIDDNDNGVHDQDEYVVSAKAVRLDRSASTLLGSDGILRLSQLQSYWTYRMEIDKNALPDPTLAPKQSTFSFVADPNHYRMIEVPLYRTGTIEGIVNRTNGNGELSAVGGLRLLLVGEDGKTETLRTFNDGGFYTYGLIPGRYTLSIDPQQLAYTKMTATTQTINIEIEAKADGDYITGLDFYLEEEPKQNESPEQTPLSNLSDIEQIEKALTYFTLAQQLITEEKLEDALEAISQSIKIIPTEQGIVLADTIQILINKKQN